MWVANFNSGDVSRVNVTTGAATNFALPAGRGPAAIAFDGSNLWTANQLANTVTRINPATQAMTNFALPASADGRWVRRPGRLGQAWTRWPLPPPKCR